MNGAPDAAKLRYRWAIISQGYLVTDCLETDTPPDDPFFLHVFMDAAKAQADRDYISFDPFNSNILLLRRQDST